jgi:hypothetical protein
MFIADYQHATYSRAKTCPIQRYVPIPINFINSYPVMHANKWGISVENDVCPGTQLDAKIGVDATLSESWTWVSLWRIITEP